MIVVIMVDLGTGRDSAPPLLSLLFLFVPQLLLLLPARTPLCLREPLYSGLPSLSLSKRVAFLAHRQILTYFFRCCPLKLLLS